MVKSILNFKIILLVVLLTGFMSCDKDTVFNDGTSDDITIEDIDLGDITEEVAGLNIANVDVEHPEAFAGKERCFTPVFPIIIVFPDESTQEVDSNNSMKLAFQIWKEANPEVKGRPRFQFPFDVTLKDGSVVTFTTKEDLRETLKSCIGERPHKGKFGRCFTPEFPLTVMFPDGTTQTMDSKEAMKAVMMEWKENNPDAEGHPEFEFPIVVTTKDGNTSTINSKEELKELAKDCRGDKKRPHFGKCLKVVFPISLELPNGEIVTADSKQELKSLLMEWRENNPDVDGRPEFVFPFDVEAKNGNIITLENKKDLVRFLKKCKRKKGGHGPG